MQKILSLVITAAILYAIVQMKGQDTPPLNPAATAKTTSDNSQPHIVPNNAAVPPAQENQSLEGNFIQKTLSSVLINVLKTEEGKAFFENILKPINRPLAGSNHGFKLNNEEMIKSMFKINSFGEGKIGPASCGHVVTIRYQILALDNSLVTEGTKTYSLGSKPIVPGLDSVIVGMMVGQSREAVLPAKYAYYEAKYRQEGINHEASYKIKVALQGILPGNFIKNEEVKIFDDEIAYKMPMLCGDSASFYAKITQLSTGRMIYNSPSNKEIKMKIGDMNYPLIFSHALYNKIPVGTRTVIAKGRAFKALATSASRIFPKEQLPAEEFFMLELTTSN